VVEPVQPVVDDVVAPVAEPVPPVVEPVVDEVGAPVAEPAFPVVGDVVRPVVEPPAMNVVAAVVEPVADDIAAPVVAPLTTEVVQDPRRASFEGIGDTLIAVAGAPGTSSDGVFRDLPQASVRAGELWAGELSSDAPRVPDEGSLNGGSLATGSFHLDNLPTEVTADLGEGTGLPSVPIASMSSASSISSATGRAAPSEARDSEPFLLPRILQTRLSHAGEDSSLATTYQEIQTSPA